MYYDAKQNRILLRDGTNLIDSFEYARRMIEGDDVSSFCVLEDEDSRKYDMVNGTSISHELYDPEPSSTVKVESHLNDLIEVIGRSPRFDHSNEQIERIDHELDFFDRNGHTEFIWRLHLLIQQFKKDGVVWGVGRGSSCASLIMYLLEVNDINPLFFDIPFSELSKEQETLYE